MYDIPEEYYDAAANMVWDFGDGIDEMFANNPEAIGPALNLIEMNDESGLAMLLWNLKILESTPSHDAMRENTMKITKRQLKKIIREEKAKILRESSYYNQEMEKHYGDDALAQRFADRSKEDDLPDPRKSPKVDLPDPRKSPKVELTDAILRLEKEIGEKGVREILNQMGY